MQGQTPARVSTKAGRDITKSLAVIALIIISLFGSPSFAAVNILPGDILVADYGAGAVIDINPITGVQTVVASGGNLVSPSDVAVASNGDIFVVDNAGPGKIVRVNPATGNQTVVSSGDIGVGLIHFSKGIAIAA